MMMSSEFPVIIATQKMEDMLIGELIQAHTYSYSMHVKERKTR